MKRKMFGLMVTVMMMLFPVLVNAEEVVEPIVKVNGKEYTTFQEAIDSVTEYGTTPTTIEVLRDSGATENVPGIKVLSSAPKNIIIDFKGHTVQFGKPLVGSPNTLSQNIHIQKGSTFVFKNGTVKIDANAAMLFQNYANLTLEDLTVDATASKRTDTTVYAMSNNYGTVKIIGETNIYSNDAAFDVYFWPSLGNGVYKEGAQVTVDTTGTIKGRIEVTSDGTDTKPLATLTIKNMKHEGELYIEEGLESQVSILGGSFSEKNDNIVLEEGSKLYEVLVGEGDPKYVVAKESELVDEVMTAKVDEKEIDKKEQELVKEAIAEKYTVLGYYDIDLGKFTPNEDLVGFTTETKEEITVTLEIPEELKAVEKGYVRNFAIIRIHDGKSDVLTATDNGDGTISFKTNKFSTYVLVYDDVVAETAPVNPPTYDGISTYLILGAVSLIGLAAIGLYIKNKRVFN